MNRCVLFLLVAGPVLPQSLRVVSEFQRVDPFGKVVLADQTPQPREILSPGVARNAFASFHIVATAGDREPFFIYIQTNPPDVFRITLYKELYVETKAGWIPDALEPQKLPTFDTLPYLPSPIPGQNTVTYWLDLWVPADAAVQRVRLEVLMKVGRGWIVYPMEVRVLPPVAPNLEKHLGALPDASDRSDAAVYEPFRHYTCNAHEPGGKDPLNVRALIHRNAEQDLALARSLAARAPGLRADLLHLAGGQDRDQWCRKPMAPPLQTEWFLHVRDAIYRKARPRSE